MKLTGVRALKAPSAANGPVRMRDVAGSVVDNRSAGVVEQD